MRSPKSRKNERGITMLMAMGLVAVVMLAAAASFAIVGREAAVQGDARRSKQAFFAAEAGLAEARERVRILLGTSSTYNDVIGALGTPVTETGVGAQTPDDPWYDVFGGWLPYTLGANAVDTSVTTGDRETVDVDGQPFVDYPDQSNVSYRVFLRDDHDDNDQTSDVNRQVWLIAVGQVQVPGSRPVRAVVQALVSNANTAPVNSPGCIGRGCGPDMSFSNAAEGQLPAAGSLTL